VQQYDFLVLYPVNPITLSKYREAFCLITPSMISLNGGLILDRAQTPSSASLSLNKRSSRCITSVSRSSAGMRALRVARSIAAGRGALAALDRKVGRAKRALCEPGGALRVSRSGFG
jgi:hypothetical protein